MSIDIVVPSAGESVSEGEISQWYKANNDIVDKDEVIAELETEKASLEIRSPERGKLIIEVEQSATVKVGQVIAKIDVSQAGVSPSTSSTDDTAVQKDATAKEEKKENEVSIEKSIHASPSVRSEIRDKNIPVATIVASGKGGRIVKEDLTPPANPDKSIEVAKTKQIPLSNLSTAREVTREKMSRIRKTIASRLLETKNSMAILTTFNEVDMTEIIEIRKKYKEEFKKKYGVGLGYNSFFMKAASLALKAFPIINSKIEGEEILFHNYEDIGIAVAGKKGLIVPVVRNVGEKSFLQVEQDILDFSLRGRENKINLEEMSGGTFSITNGGIFGSMLSTPIINAPQSAILGLHNIVERPVAIGNEVKIRPIMYVALSYDHRQIDGADAVQFLFHIKKSIEDPAKLLLGI